MSRASAAATADAGGTAVAIGGDELARIENLTVDVEHGIVFQFHFHTTRHGERYAIRNDEMDIVAHKS